MTDQQTTIESLTVCTLCKRGIALTGLSVPIVGEKPEQRAARQVAALEDHLNRRHPQEAAYINGMRKWLQDFMTIGVYESGDPVLKLGFEYARAIIHSLTRKNRLSDQELQTALATLGKDEKEIAGLMPIAKYLRDFLSEQGDFEHPAVKAAKVKAS